MKPRTQEVERRLVKCSCCRVNSLVVARDPHYSPDPRCYGCRQECYEDEGKWVHRE